MMVHGYKVGRYPAIIRKRYEDGTVNYCSGGRNKNPPALAVGSVKGKSVSRWS